MAFFLGSFLHFLLIPWTLAGPASMGSLTPILAQVTRPCAQGCLESFIAINFPPSSCGTPPDFSCLCVSSSVSGLTIGEGGLQCLYSQCPDYDFDNSVAYSVYEVCADIQGAKPNTHSTLTATLSIVPSTTLGARTTPSGGNSLFNNSPSRSIFPSASSAAFGTNTVTAAATVSSSHFPKSTSSIESSRTKKAASDGVGLNTIPTTTSTSSTSSSTSSVAAATSSSAVTAAAAATKPVLTKPQIAGVTVASVGGAAIAFGLILFGFCLRRKHGKRRSGWSFGGDKIIDSEETTPDMGGGAFENHPQHSSPPTAVAVPPPPRRDLRIVTPASSSDDGWNRYQRSMNPEEDIVLPVHPPPLRSLNHSPIDPITPASYRTSSQLLPDKPTYSLFPPPLRITPRNSSAPAGLRPSGSTAPQHSNSPHTKYSPRFPSNLDTSQAHLQAGSGRQRSLSDPFYDDFHRSPPPNVYPYVQTSRPRSPGSSRLVPSNYPGAWSTPTDVVRKPVPALESPSAKGLRPLPSRAQQTSFSKPYPPPPPPIEQHYLAAIERSHSRKDPRRRPSNSSSKLTRFSNGSETSFEDADEEEAPATRKFLSPVAESPALRSPLRSGVTYPPIPVSAAESPARTPPNRAPVRPEARPEAPPRSDSLLTKRLGEQKAREIASRLQGTHPAVNEDVRSTAKWKILVSPGLDDPESSGSPQSARNNGRTPRGR